MHPPRPTLNLRPSPCAHHIALPMSLVRPNAHPGRTPSSKPDPLAPPYHEKTVTLPRHPFPPVPHPTPPTSCPSPRLRHFSPPIRPNPAISPTPLKHTYIRATLAQARDRPRRPETLPPERGKAPGNRRASLVGALWQRRHSAPCPPLSRGVTSVSQMTRAGITDSRRTGDTLSYDTHRMSQNRTEFAFLLPREQRCWVTPGNLKQPPPCPFTGRAPVGCI